MPGEKRVSKSSKDKSSKGTKQASTKAHGSCSCACGTRDSKKGSKKAGASCRCAQKKAACSSWKAYVNQLLERISRGQSVPDLVLDENNNCMLLFNEKVVLNMDLDENGGVLMVYAYVGEVPLGYREAIYEQALDENFFWRGTAGATFGRDKHSQSMVLTRSYTLPLANVDDFEDQLSKLVDVAEKWIARIENCENTDENF